ncbi:hypothetical protein RCL1_002480 [Eukaryota sp. TZLM3-RCL]
MNPVLKLPDDLEKALEDIIPIELPLCSFNDENETVEDTDIHFTSPDRADHPPQLDEKITSPVRKQSFLQPQIKGLVKNSNNKHSNTNRDAMVTKLKSIRGFFSAGVRGTASRLPRFNESQFYGKDDASQVSQVPNSLSQRLPLSDGRTSPIKQTPIIDSDSRIIDTMPIPKKEFVLRARKTLKLLMTSDGKKNTNQSIKNELITTTNSQLVQGRTVLTDMWDLVEAEKIPLTPVEKALSQSVELTTDLCKSTCLLNLICDETQKSQSQKRRCNSQTQMRNVEPALKLPRLHENHSEKFEDFIGTDYSLISKNEKKSPKFTLSPITFI